MADDFSRTLNDVMSGYQGMSTTISHFGGPTATPMGSMMSAQAPQQQTPPPPVPTMTVQPPPPPPPTPPFDPMSGMSNVNQPFHTASQSPGVMGGMQAGMAQAQSYNMNPMYASYMDPSMNMASAGHMTPARAGVFRQAPVSDFRAPRPLGTGGQRVPDAMVPFSPGLVRNTPMPQFSRGYDAAMYTGSEQARLISQGTAGYAEAAAGNLVAAGGMYAGGIGGAALGGFMGGPAGAKFGAEMGMLGGAFAQYIPGVTQATEATFRPAIERRADAIRGQFASRQFMVGASRDLDISGSGLSTSASQALTYDFDRMAGASGGGRNRRDFMEIMQAGGEQGLMDFAQNKDQIVDTVKQLSGIVGTFAEITGDPDFRNNIQKIGQLRRLGVGLNEMNQAVSNMDQYARMAGMDVDQLMQTQGLQGAGIYQGSGLVAGQGLQTGMMGGGQARQMVAGGAVNARNLALYGGVSGMGQRMTEMNASFLSNVAQPLLPYFASEGEDGKLSINQDRVKAFQSGDVTYQDALRKASEMDMSQGARQRIMGFRGRELTAELGESLGPEGTQQAMVRAIMSIQKDNPNLDFMTAAELAAGPDGAAMIRNMGNKGYQEGTMRQMQQELDRRRYDARQGGGLVQRSFMEKYGPGDPTSFFGDMQDGVSGYLADYEESKRLEAVGTTRFKRDTGASSIGLGTKEGGPAALSAAYGRLGLYEKSMSADASGLERAMARARGRGIREGGGYGSSFERTYRPFTEDYQSYQQQVTGTSAYGRAAGLYGDMFKLGVTGGIFTNADEMMDVADEASRGFQPRNIEKRAARMMQINERTTGQSVQERASARSSVQDRVGADKYAKVTKILGRKISAKNKLNIGDAALLTDTEIGATLQSQGIDPSDMSADEIAAIQRDSANTMGTESRDEYLNSMGKQTAAAQTSKAGQSFLSGGGVGALNDALESTGFSDLDDMSKAEKLALKELTTYKDVGYLVLAAAKQDGSWGSTYAKKLQERDGKAFAGRLEKAQKYFRGLPSDVKKAIMERSGKLMNENSNWWGGSQKTADIDPANTKKRLDALSDIIKIKTADEARNKVATQLEDLGADKAGSTKELIADFQGLTSDQRAEAREKGLGGILDMVLADDFKADSAGIAAVNKAMAGMDPSTLDKRDKSGKSGAVSSQVEAIESQREFFTDLNRAMGGNSIIVQSNTEAMKNLTRAIENNSPIAEKDTAAGKKSQPTATGGGV